jgi:hypothetical protein
MSLNAVPMGILKGMKILKPRECLSGYEIVRSSSKSPDKDIS